MTKNKSNGKWWKILIVLTFLISLTLLFLVIFEFRQVEVIKTKDVKVDGYITHLDRFKIEILESHCINDAYVYYPLIEPDKIWITQDYSLGNGRCFLIYKEKVWRLKLKKIKSKNGQI